MDFTFALQTPFWIKMIILILIGFYIIFTFVVFTQVKTMTSILHLPHATFILKLVSKIHIFLAISLFLLTIVIL
jgi:hypothetical protein